MTRRLRQRIGGETRVRIGHFLDDLLDRTTSSDDPVDVRRLLEKHRMGEVYDQVMEEIVWGEAARLTPDEVLLVLRPDGERPLLVERGPSVMVDGKPLPDVSGRQLVRSGWGRSGFGLVKVIVKHGELSEQPRHLRVTREDMLRIPDVLREYEPIPNEKGFRTWIVERQDGRQLVIGEGGGKTDAGRLVTVFVPDDGFEKTLSKKRAPVESHSATFSALPKDTDGSTFYRDFRSPQEQMPDRGKNLSGDITLAENTPDVKENSVDFELQRLNDAPAVATKEATDGDSSWLHGQSAGENTGDASLTMELQRLNDEGRLTPEDLAELDALDRDARRLETLERINMGLVNCIWCNLPICGRLQK